MKNNKDAKKYRIAKSKGINAPPADQYGVAPGASQNPIEKEITDHKSELNNDPVFSTAEIIDFSDAADS